MKCLSVSSLSSVCSLVAVKAAGCLFLLSVLHACSKNESPSDAATAQSGSNEHQPKTSAAAKKPAASYKTIEWTDLIPEDDLEALLAQPDYLDEIEDGSEADQLPSQTQNSFAGEDEDRYHEALSSTRIIPEYDNQDVRIPGFIVPLEFDDDLTITQFFLVPYFGACIHLPAPPPNQVIYITFPEGVQMEALYDPFWITGTLRTSIVENDIAKAAYTMEATSITPYDDFVDAP